MSYKNMILTPHILVGAAIGSQTSSPIIAFIFGFVSHYFLDALPHAEYSPLCLKDKKIKFDAKFMLFLAEIGLDFSAGMVLALWLIQGKSFSSTALIAMLAALIPDGLLFLHWRSPQNRFLNFFARPHHALHFLKNRSPVWLGLVVEAVVTVSVFLFLFLG